MMLLLDYSDSSCSTPAKLAYAFRSYHSLIIIFEPFLNVIHHTALMIASLLCTLTSGPFERMLGSLALTICLDQLSNRLH